MLSNTDRFRLPDDPSDRDLKINELYFDRLDVLEEIKEQENNLEETENRQALVEKIEFLKNEADELSRRIDDMRCLL